MKRVLNVGGNTKSIPLPVQYDGFEHVLLDISPNAGVDIVADARNLLTLEAGQFDAVYCSHNLEHYFEHDVPKVLAGFKHVLKEGGFAHIRVPDIQQVMKAAVEHNLDIEDVLYESTRGPITVKDVIYGYGAEIRQSGNDFFAHKTGFSQKSLIKALESAGFAHTFSGTAPLEIGAVAFKGLPDRDLCKLFNIPYPPQM